MDGLIPRRGVLLLLGVLVLGAGSLLPDQGADFTRALEGPGRGALLGTDHFGRDLALTVWSAAGRSALLAAVVAAATALLGGILGALGAFRPAAARLTGAAMVATITLPSLLITFIVAGITGSGRGAVAITVLVTHWPIAAQLIGSRLREESAAGWTRYDRSLGASRGQIVVWHLLPGAAGRIATAVGVLFPSAVIHEATTAFLGIGVDPGAVSLGPLIAWGRDDVATGAWWALLVPALALVAMVVPPAVAARSLGTAEVRA